MSEKFTPGPWWVQNGTDVFTGLNAKRRDGVESANNDGWHIADCSMGVTFDTDGQKRTLLPSEMVANAHLIAAAPEMYEALQAILPYVPISSASEGGAVARSWNVIAADKVRAALKKARGES